jgi:hypothetical protein
LGDQIENYEKGGDMWQARGKRKMHTGFWWGNMNQRDHFEDLGLFGRIIYKGALAT